MHVAESRRTVAPVYLVCQESAAMADALRRLKQITA